MPRHHAVGVTPRNDIAVLPVMGKKCKETFGAKTNARSFHPHLGPPPSRGRKDNEGCPLAAWFYWESEVLTPNVSSVLIESDSLEYRPENSQQTSQSGEKVHTKDCEELSKDQGCKTDG